MTVHGYLSDNNQVIARAGREGKKGSGGWGGEKSVRLGDNSKS